MDQASASPAASCACNPGHRELHHLVHGPRVDPEPPRRRPLAQTLNANRMPNPQIIRPRSSSPALCRLKAKRLSAAGFLLRRHRETGRFSEGLLLRRLQPRQIPLRAIDGAIEYTWRGDLVDPQGCKECGRLPMAPWHARDESLAPRAAAITTYHIGRRARFVDEDQAFRGQLALAGTPFVAGCGDIRSILLGRSL